MEKRLEIHSKRNYRKYLDMWRLKNSLLNDQLVMDRINGEIKKFLKSKENENTTYQKLMGTARAVLKGKFIAMSAFI
jgi:hypothetical protein